MPEDYIDALLDEKYMEDLIASKLHKAIRSQGVSKIEDVRGNYLFILFARTYSPVSMYKQGWAHSA